METIGNFWWFWLIGMIVCYGTTIINQIQLMKKMFTLSLENDDDDDNFFSGFSNFTEGLTTLVISASLGTLFTALLLVSIIVNIIAWINL